MTNIEVSEEQSSAWEMLASSAGYKGTHPTWGEGARTNGGIVCSLFSHVICQYVIFYLLHSVQLITLSPIQNIIFLPRFWWKLRRLIIMLTSDRLHQHIKEDMNNPLVQTNITEAMERLAGFLSIGQMGERVFSDLLDTWWIIALFLAGCALFLLIPILFHQPQARPSSPCSGSYWWGTWVASWCCSPSSL